MSGMTDKNNIWIKFCVSPIMILAEYVHRDTLGVCKIDGSISNGMIERDESNRSSLRQGLFIPMEDDLTILGSGTPIPELHDIFYADKYRLW